MSDITLHPDTQPQTSILNGNKGLFIAISVVIIVGIIGFSAFLAFDSNDKYEGLIKKVETQTQKLKENTKNTPR